MDDDAEFGFSPADEAAFAAAFDEINAPNSSAKRKHASDNDEPPARKQISISYPTKSPLGVKVLNEQFGLDQFRLEQEPVISRILGGGSAVVLFPTGGGKSLCYQVPAVAFSELDRQASIRCPEDSGVTIVVSPLIALMKDQVDTLIRLGISAACLDSTKSRDQFFQITDDLRAGRLKLLYCAPERLNNEGFVRSIKSVRGGVRLVAVDEAHCISEWGHQFRPDYLKVARFVTEIQAERVICLTATATTKVAQDICDAFGIGKGGLFRTSMYRPNLRLLAVATNTTREKYPKMFKFLREHPGSTIVYITTKKESELLAEKLRKRGFDAKAFHSGMQTKVKTELQEEFMAKDGMVIVATIAFGMGIDKADIRNVIHFDMPGSVEGYSQQVGRAGRDGKPSTCLFYLCHEDFYLRNYFTYKNLPSENSVRRFLQSIFCPVNMRLSVGDTFAVSHYSQSREFDLQLSTLETTYAELELQLNLIRALTTQYSKYSYTIECKHSIQNDTTPVAEAIRKSARKAVKWYHCNVDAVCSNHGILRADVVTKLEEWNESGAIVLKTAGVERVYRVLCELPSTPEDIEEIVGKLYARMQSREEQDCQRTRDFIDLITSKRCISRGLAAYFDNGSHDMPAECGHCIWCETHTQVVLSERPPAQPHPAHISALLKACSARDDPRFLARIAFGISSPRVRAMKLENHSVFGSMRDCDFLELVRVFTDICGDA